jgi:Zn-dependent protease with chaperone function
VTAKPFTRFAVLTAAASLGPLLTLHAALVHLGATSGHGVHNLLEDPDAVAFPILVTMALSTLAGLALGAWRLRDTAARHHALLAQSDQAEHGKQRFYVLESDEIVVFASGVIRPRIFVSRGAQAMLSSTSLTAALLHEAAHVQRGDLADRPILAVVERSLGWIPAVRRWTESVVLRSECLADDDAVAAGASRTALFDAIVAASTGPAHAAALASAPVLPRLTRLANPGLPVPAVSIAGSLIIGVWMLAPPLLANLIVWVGVLCARQGVL